MVFSIMIENPLISFMVLNLGYLVHQQCKAREARHRKRVTLLIPQLNRTAWSGSCSYYPMSVGIRACMKDELHTVN